MSITTVEGGEEAIFIKWVLSDCRLNIQQLSASLKWSSNGSHIEPDYTALWWHCIINSSTIHKTCFSKHLLDHQDIWDCFLIKITLFDPRLIILQIYKYISKRFLLLVSRKVNNFRKLSPFVCLRSAVVKILYGKENFLETFTKQWSHLDETAPGGGESRSCSIYCSGYFMRPTNTRLLLESLTKGLYSMFHCPAQ